MCLDLVNNSPLKKEKKRGGGGGGGAFFIFEHWEEQFVGLLCLAVKYVC